VFKSREGVARDVGDWFAKQIVAEELINTAVIGSERNIKLNMRADTANRMASEQVGNPRGRMETYLVEQPPAKKKEPAVYGTAKMITKMKAMKAKITAVNPQHRLPEKVLAWGLKDKWEERLYQRQGMREGRGW